MKRLTIATCLFAAPFASAAITVNSYSHSPNPSSSYPDSGNQELIDGVADVVTWGEGVPIGSSQVGPFVGWLNTNASTTFTFDSVQTVRQVTVWAADSDSAAGVNFPSTITLTDPNSSFTQTFGIPNPAGSEMRPIVMEGFAVTTNQLQVAFTRGGQWTMLTEVTFDTIPEPGAPALLSLAIISLIRRRQR
ncbi:MAG: hypothetical protein Q7Q71_13075 [Verrucomicrobiota bacterium JB023]|nr:hypothetical protein [Verrucomicrobiota bacterium JB023]